MTWDPSENKIIASPNITDASETEVCLKLANVQGLVSNTSECFVFKLTVHKKLKNAGKKVEKIIKHVPFKFVKVKQEPKMPDLSNLSIEEICENEEFRNSTLK